MNSLPHEDTPANGAAATSATVAPSLSLAEKICEMESLIATLQIHTVEHCHKIHELENAKMRFENAIKGISKIIFEGPMSKIILASMPKEAQAKIKEFVNGN